MDVHLAIALIVVGLLPMLQSRLLGQPRLPDKQNNARSDTCGPPFSLGRLSDVDVCSHSPRKGQTLTYNGTHWVPTTPLVRTGSLQHIVCQRGRVKVCHVSASGQASEICVEPSQVDRHLMHFHDQIGPCPDQPAALTGKSPLKGNDAGDDECPAKCDHRCSLACDDVCPSACDDVCPSACERIEGPPGPQGKAGLACWDTNENGQCDLSQEDVNRDGICSVDGDCKGPIGPMGKPSAVPGPAGPHGLPGIHCWDTNQDGACSLPEEDRNHDGTCDVADCQGQCPKQCADSSRHEPADKRGISCWDLNEDGKCQLETEDTNQDEKCDVQDCRSPEADQPTPIPGPPGPHGLPGLHCWDLNEDGACTLPQEDRNHDGRCTVQDCLAQAPFCCYVNVEEDRHPDHYSAQLKKRRQMTGFRQMKENSALVRDEDHRHHFLGQVIWTLWTGEGRCRDAPKGWVPCNGQILPAKSHPRLASLIGASYGGDGKEKLGIPKF